MKITTFNPLIITKDPEYAIKVFEDLGFERHHTKENISETKTTDVRMKNANGFYFGIGCRKNANDFYFWTILEKCKRFFSKWGTIRRFFEN